MEFQIKRNEKITKASRDTSGLMESLIVLVEPCLKNNSYVKLNTVYSTANLTSIKEWAINGLFSDQMFTCNKM